MEISQTLLNEDCPIKYYYCNIDNKEYVLSGDKDGMFFDCLLMDNLGNIIINIIDNSDLIISNINQCIDEISHNKYYKDDEILNQDIVWKSLSELQKRIEKTNIKIFYYTDFPTYISKRFVNFFSEINIKKEIYKNDTNNLLEMEKILNNEFASQNMNALEWLRESNKKKKMEIDELEKVSFKSFVLQELHSYITDFKLLIFNLTLFASKDKEIKVQVEGGKQEKLKSTTDKIRLLQSNYNLNIFDSILESKCYHKIAVIENNKIYLDIYNENTLNKINNKSNLDVRVIQLYKIESLIDLLALSLTKIITNKVNIKICANCMNYFIPQNRADEKYCNRKSPQNPNKTCKEYGAKKAYRDEIKSIPIKCEHNRTSQFYRMKINRAKDEKEKKKYERQFHQYKENYQKRKEKYIEKKLNENDFVKWIKEQKEGVNSGSTRTNQKQEI